MKRRLRKDVTRAINVLAFAESRRRYEEMAMEMRVRAHELLDTGLSLDRLISALCDEFDIRAKPADFSGSTGDGARR